MTTNVPDGITCAACVAKFAGVPRNEHGFALLDSVYDCGNRAESSLGHQLVFTRAGRTALCIVPLRDAARRDGIVALRREAGEAGDLAQVAICDRALAGDEDAVVECTRVIADARAQ